MVKSPQKWGKGLLNTSGGGKGSKQNKKQQPINEYSDDDISDDDEHGGARWRSWYHEFSEQELIGKLWMAQANIKLRDKTNQDPGIAT